MEPTESFSPELPPAFPTQNKTQQVKEGFRPVADRESYVDVPGLLVQFDRQSPVLHIVESLLYSNSQPPDSIQPLFSALANYQPRYWHERVVSAWALGRMQLNEQEHDAAASMLLGILAEDDSQTMAHSIWVGLNWSVWTVLSASMLMAAVNLIDQEAIFAFVGGTALCASTLTVPIAIHAGRNRTRRNHIQRAAAAEALGRLRSVASLEALADALFDDSIKVRESAALALRLILPELSSSDYGRFEPSTIHALGRVLDTSDVLLVFTTLEALEKIGTPAGMPYVSRIAKTGQTPMVRELAQRVLTTLEGRKRRQGDAEQLGRPVILAQEAAQQELLRATAVVGVDEDL